MKQSTAPALLPSFASFNYINLAIIKNEPKAAEAIRNARKTKAKVQKG
uniref:Uncharacterized protein n=1 Tax=Vibrio ordalii TaxID=28174 RepID=A0A0H3ZXI6_9VIBR|nr:hypothetical protein [Vibrio ordalii]